MTRLYAVAGLILSTLILLLGGPNVGAISDNVVISQVQLGAIAAVEYEFVELYNNSPDDVEITNWCLYYINSGLTASKMVCFTPSDATSHLYIPGHSRMLAVSDELMTASTPMPGDVHFPYKLSGTSGYVRLQTGGGAEIDKVGWGVSTPTLDLAPKAAAGSVLQRKSVNSDVLQDSDVDSVDFEVALPRESYQIGFIYEVRDICANLDGVQSVLPVGYIVDGVNCVLPATDLCPNLEGLQAILPVGMRKDGAECVISQLVISEILPNASGSDTGGEFIEIYNPNNVEINLIDYVLSIGPNYSSSYQFPVNATIGPGQYAVFYNNDVNFTLLNTTGSVRLQTTANLVIFETPVYDSPSEGFSWALIDGTWQYTNLLTPGAINLRGDDLTEMSATGVLAPCDISQERNPATGRCRKIVSPTSVLAPCKDGQYRSEETNRCRNILADVSSLAVCAEGQERNPKTNRCRSVATNADTTLEPCKDGQERNPETNRCRNISKMVAASYAPEKTEPISNYFGWWVLGGVGFVAIVYGLWEWRYEVIKAGRKLKLALKLRK